MKSNKGDATQKSPRNLTETKKYSSRHALEQYPERDSLGLFYANPNNINEMAPMGGPLALNHEPLASIYTGAPEPASGIPSLVPDSACGFAFSNRPEILV